MNIKDDLEAAIAEWRANTGDNPPKLSLSVVQLNQLMIECGTIGVSPLPSDHAYTFNDIPIEVHHEHGRYR